MASEAETEPNSTPPQLQLTSFPNLKPLQHPYSCAATPLHTSASVPFSWEQEPGKPLPCLTLTLSTSHRNLIKCLELPPRLVNETKFTKTPSPTTVLEGPYYLGRSILGSSSFRFLRKRQKSFDGELSFAGSGGSSPEKGVRCCDDIAAVAKSHFWASIYGTFKHVIPRRRRNNEKKNAL